jgi:hypothetical protein
MFLIKRWNMITLFSDNLHMHVCRYVLTRNFTGLFCLLSILYRNSNVLHVVSVLNSNITYWWLRRVPDPTTWGTQMDTYVCIPSILLIIMNQYMFRDWTFVTYASIYRTDDTAMNAAYCSRGCVMINNTRLSIECTWAQRQFLWWL